MSVEFRDVVKRYGTATAVAGVSFVVEAGTLVTLLGVASIFAAAGWTDL